MAKRPKQLGMKFGWGGKREGAGRKPASKHPPVHHVKRPTVPSGAPSLVTLRVRGDVPSLRKPEFLREFEARLRAEGDRGDFRVCRYAVQRDRVCFVVEAAGKDALGRGMKSIGIRLARTANRVFRRKGPVLFGRYQLRILRTKREVRDALGNVLRAESRGASPVARPRYRLLAASQKSAER